MGGLSVDSDLFVNLLLVVSYLVVIPQFPSAHVRSIYITINSGRPATVIRQYLAEICCVRK